MNRIIPLAILSLAAPLFGGCYVYTDPAPPAVAVEADTYQPAYYDGAVVYYDTVGTPFVYVGDEVHYVPRSYVHYNVLVGHYHHNTRSYHAWYRSHPHYRQTRVIHRR